MLYGIVTECKVCTGKIDNNVITMYGGRWVLEMSRGITCLKYMILALAAVAQLVGE